MLPSQKEETPGGWWGRGSGRQRWVGGGIKTKQTFEGQRAESQSVLSMAAEMEPQKSGGSGKEEQGGWYNTESCLPPGPRRLVAPGAGVTLSLASDLTPPAPWHLLSKPSSPLRVHRDHLWDQLQEGN